MQEKGRQIKIALAGNPNSGKTTLFNALTGSKQYVGNWPGVTVEKKEGRLKGHDDIIIQDLPGIYSLSPYSLEEVIARNYLVNDRPDVILNIIDASNLERNLYLTTQLSELGIPLVACLNMMDVVEKSGDRLEVDKLAAQLGCPVVAISALKGWGLDKAVQACLKEAEKKSWQSPIVSFSLPVEGALTNIAQLGIQGIPAGRERWFLIKMLEGDQKILDQLPLTADQRDSLIRSRQEVELSMDDDMESLISNERYEAIQKLLKGCYRKKRQKMTTSDKIDRWVTNRWLALPIFVGIMFLVYWVSLGLGTRMTDWVNDTLIGEWIQPAVSGWLEGAGASEAATSLVVDGVIGGLGAPIGFLPQMAMVFLCLAILEDCGYMARVAFIMDRLFRRFGLSGKSFISFLVSSGCAVPGIMACRTIESSRDREMTMIGTCMIPCGAKLPIIALVAGYCLDSDGSSWWIAPVIYLVSLLVIILTCIILKKTRSFSGEPAPFVMELPAYHLPTFRGVFDYVGLRVKGFLKKAATRIFAMCVVMWFLSSYGFENGAFGLVDAENSLLALIGGFIAPLFIPLGFGNWQSVAAVFAGFTAKESVLSTMGILAGLGEIDAYEASMHTAFSSFFPSNLVAISFLFFNLYNTPCLAAVSNLKAEIGDSGKFWKIIAFQNINAYCIALMVYQLGGLLTGTISFSIWSLLAMAILAFYLYLLFRPAPEEEGSRQKETPYGLA